MTFTDEQFRRLAGFETAFRTAIRSSYAMHPGHSAMATITLVWTEATGNRLPNNFSCTSCVLEILQTVGAAWIADAEERERLIIEQQRALHEEENRVKVTDDTPETVQQAHVTTQEAQEAPKTAKTGKSSSGKKKSATTKKSAK